MSFNVSVKWGKEKFKDLTLDSNESPEVFKAQLFALTGVEIGRQKLMFKGKNITDSWDGIKFKDKMSFLLMGTTDAIVEAPEEKTVFVEDLSQNQLVAVSDLPPGLVNLGNTCYMNSTIQCLRAAPDIKAAIEEADTDACEAMVAPLKSLNQALTAKKDNLSVQTSLFAFLNALRQANPQFAQQENGHYSQQDAAECWNAMTRSLNSIKKNGEPLIKKYFGLTYQDKLINSEAQDEAATETTSHQLQLSCHINKDVKYMMSGLESSLKEEIIKHSETLGRDATYIKTSQIDRLPKYLAVNFVRFYYKQSAGENCKIRKEVKFPFEFDAFKLCTPALQGKLQTMRDNFDAYRDYETELQASSAGKKSKKEDAKAGVDETYPVEFEDDEGSNNSGYYELKAVLTHKGRAANSGHYVAWTKQDDGSWVLFDDDKVTTKTEQDIMALSGSGGADWHTAYILVYAAKPCRKIPESAASMAMETSNDNAE